jgi:hypothetical protein
MSRKPKDPVSSKTWSMVWHTAVPGRQTVTLTYGTLNTPPAAAGPLSTLMAMELLETEGGAVTGMVTLFVVLPQVSVKIALPAVAGATTRVPLIATCPDQAPEASQEDTPVFWALHVKVNDCPATTVDGAAEMFTDGCGVGTGVGAGAGVLEPPPPHAASARQVALAASKAHARRKRAAPNFETISNLIRCRRW